MSRKVQQFANVITQPLNIYNFAIEIPSIQFSNIVQSTTFPSEKLRIMTLYTHGEKVQYPSIPENGGQWTIKIPENDSGLIRREFEALKSRCWNQMTGLLTPPKWFNISVSSRDLADNLVFSAVLHGCWIMGRNDVSLSNQDVSTSWAWDYVFMYQWLEDKDHNNQGTPNPFG